MHSVFFLPLSFFPTLLLLSSVSDLCFIGDVKSFPLRACHFILFHVFWAYKHPAFNLSGYAVQQLSYSVCNVADVETAGGPTCRGVCTVCVCVLFVSPPCHKVAAVSNHFQPKQPKPCHQIQPPLSPLSLPHCCVSPVSLSPPSPHLPPH